MYWFLWQTKYEEDCQLRESVEVQHGLALPRWKDVPQSGQRPQRQLEKHRHLRHRIRLKLARGVLGEVPEEAVLAHVHPVQHLHPQRHLLHVRLPLPHVLTLPRPVVQPGLGLVDAGRHNIRPLATAAVPRVHSMERTPQLGEIGL